MEQLLLTVDTKEHAENVLQYLSNLSYVSEVKIRKKKSTVTEDKFSEAEKHEISRRLKLIKTGKTKLYKWEDVKNKILTKDAEF